MTDERKRDLDLENLMPKFRSQLEDRLVKEATLAERKRRGRRRIPIVAGASVALAAAILLVLTFSNRNSNTAFGHLSILDSPTVDVTHQINAGLSMRRVLGPDARLDRAHEIAFFGLKAYLVEGGHGWCLVAPDAGAHDPDRERGVTCTTAAELQKFGISLRVGSRYVAAVPDDVKRPVLHRRDGRVVRLQPDRLGVVKIGEVRSGDTVTLFSKSGAKRQDRLAGS